MLPYFSRRATVRSFDPVRPVDPALIDRLLEQAVQAPTTGNMQLYSVVVNTDPAAVARLRPLHFNQPASAAPALVTFCADYARYAAWCRLNDADPGCDNLQSLMAAVLDTVIVAQQFTTLAELDGLGVCWLGTTLYNAPQIAAELRLPPLTLPVITLAVGWPAEMPAPSDRLPLDAIRHREAYAAPDADALRRAYAAKEALPENRAFVEQNGLDNLAQVYARVRYPRASAEAFSRTLADFLAAQGFINTDAQ